MSFHQLPSKALHHLRPLLKSQLPASTMTLNIMDLVINGKYPESYRVDVHSYNGIPKEPESLFLDILIRSRHQMEPISVLHTPENPSIAMLNAFISYHDWTYPQCLESVKFPVAAHIVKSIIRKGGGLSFYPLTSLYLPMEQALKFDLSNCPLNHEFEFDKLLPEHAEKINFYWDYGFDGGHKMLKENLKTMGGLGAFKKTNDGSDPRSSENLVGWVTLQHLGSLGALHSLGTYRGKGLAKAIMKSGSKWMAQQGMIPFVQVEFYNTSSFKVMDALGYKPICDSYFVLYDPPDKENDKNK